MNDPRQALADAANSVVGWISPNDNYLNLIDPGDPTPRQRSVAEESDCGLVALGIEEIVFDFPTRAPYKDGSAFQLVYTRACGNPWAPGGAFRLATFDEPPQVGDLIEYGPGPSGAPAHMEHIVEATVNDTSLSLVCVAGGERNEGSETVALMSRELTWNNSHWVDNANGRSVIGVVDAEILASMYPMK